MSEDSRGKSEDGKLLYCSFCGKSQHEVRKLIAGPSVFICDECVELCNDIIREEIAGGYPSDGRPTSYPSPARSTPILNQVCHRAGSSPRKVLSVAVYNHYKRLETRMRDKGKEGHRDCQEQYSTELVPTGLRVRRCLRRRMARLAQRPFHHRRCHNPDGSGICGRRRREHHSEAVAEV